jgi:hypothetical protein
VLAIGSVKMLGEKLKKEEYIALGLLIAGIVLVSLSRLSISADLDLFKDNKFVTRIGVASGGFLAAWLAFYYGGKASKKKAIPMAIGSGLPFALGNIWMNPFFLSLTMIFAKLFGMGGGDASWYTIIIFLISGVTVAVTNIAGLVHFNKAMAEGNASIVIPLQQLPQQIAPIITYFLIFMPDTELRIEQYFFMFGGIALIVAAGFILGKRQSEFENKFKG